MSYKVADFLHENGSCCQLCFLGIFVFARRQYIGIVGQNNNITLWA